MNKQFFFYPAILFFVLGSLHADTVSRRAAITGGGGPGRCAIEVNVDHEAQVEILGDTANLRTLGGQPAFWRSFECNVPLPQTPRDFQISRINGRGFVRLLKDPSSNNGTAVIHVSDPKAGRGVYSLDLTWRKTGSGWGPGPLPGGGWGPRPEPGPGGGGWFATRSCQDSVTSWLNRDGYQVTSFGRMAPEDRPGPNRWISGLVTGKRGSDYRRFSFVCSVDVRSGQVRYVDVRRHVSHWSHQ
jgi:hypothetical protein